MMAAKRQVSDFTKQEKSLLFARVMEWETKTHEVVVGGWLFRPDASHRWVSNLYDPANMHLAWRVLNWGYTQHDRMIVVVDGPDVPLAYWGWRINNLLWSAARMKANKAARHILDGIFDLAIKAGQLKLQENDD